MIDDGPVREMMNNSISCEGAVSGGSFEKKNSNAGLFFEKSINFEIAHKRTKLRKNCKLRWEALGDGLGRKKIKLCFVCQKMSTLRKSIGIFGVDCS